MFLRVPIHILTACSVLQLAPSSHGAEWTTSPPPVWRSNKGFHSTKVKRAESWVNVLFTKAQDPIGSSSEVRFSGDQVQVLTLYIPPCVWVKDCSLQRLLPRLAKPSLLSQLCPQARPLLVYLYATTLPSCPSVCNFPDSQSNYI